MKIGLVGYQGSGKSTLFEWLTGVRPDPAQAHTAQAAMATIPNANVAPLCAIYHPKKITQAALEIVDTPGLARSREGNPARLALLREAGCLVLVVGAFAANADPMAELRNFEEDLLLADLEIVHGRIEKLRESIKKGRPDREKEQAELAALEPLLAALESGTHLHAAGMTDDQVKATRSFRLLTERPRLVVINLSDDDTNGQRFLDALSGRWSAVAVPVGLEVELERMSPEERAEFCREMGLVQYDRDDLIRKLLDVSGQMIYFTAGDKEVRTWLLRKGGTALEAAANIHSDLARGFIRAEVMQCDDLIRLGSEREIKAHNLMRQEPKDYVVREGDILHVKFSV
jgi:ribosome-binding ATPase YchF (GTP1/OBG family)